MSSPLTPTTFVTAPDIVAHLGSKSHVAITEKEAEVVSVAAFHQQRWLPSMCISEQDFYSLLITKYHCCMWSYPYLINDEIQKFTGFHPVKYYLAILSTAIERDITFDAIPLFTATEIKRLYKIERTRYLALVQQVKENMTKLKPKQSLRLLKKRDQTEPLKLPNLPLSPKLHEKLPLPWNKMNINRSSMTSISQRKGPLWKRDKEHETLREAMTKIICMKDPDFTRATQGGSLPAAEGSGSVESQDNQDTGTAPSDTPVTTTTTTTTTAAASGYTAFSTATSTSYSPSSLPKTVTLNLTPSTLTTIRLPITVMAVEMNDLTPKECLSLIISGLVSEEYIIELDGFVRQKRILTKRGGFLLHSSPNMKVHEDILYSMLVALSGAMRVSELLECVCVGDELNRQLVNYVLLIAIRLGYIEYYPDKPLTLSPGWNQNILKSATDVKRDVEFQTSAVAELLEKGEGATISDSIRAGLAKNFTILYPAPLSGILMVGASKGDGAKQIQLLGQKMLETGRIMPAESAELVALLPYDALGTDASELTAEGKICSSLRGLILTIMGFCPKLKPPFPHFLQLSSAKRIPQSKRHVMIVRNSSLFVTVSSGVSPTTSFPVLEDTFNIGPTVPAAASILRMLWLYKQCGRSFRGLVIPRGVVLDSIDTVFAAWKDIDELNAMGQAGGSVRVLQQATLDVVSTSFETYKRARQEQGGTFVIADATPKQVKLDTLSLRNVPSDKAVCLLLDIEVVEEELLCIPLPLTEEERASGSTVPYVDKLVACGIADCVGRVVFARRDPTSPFLPYDLELGVSLNCKAGVDRFATHLTLGSERDQSGDGFLEMHNSCRSVSTQIEAFSAPLGFTPSPFSQDMAPAPTAPVVFSGASFALLG